MLLNGDGPVAELIEVFPCPRERKWSASSAGCAGAILRLLASGGGAPAPRRPPARTASGGGFGRGAEPPSELPSRARLPRFEPDAVEHGLPARLVARDELDLREVHVQARAILAEVGVDVL